jgi:hypothetical protein
LKYEAIGEDKARTGQALRIAGGCGIQISRKSAHEGGKVVSPKHRQRLAPGNNPGTHFIYWLSRPLGLSTVRRIMSMKVSMPPSGIKPETFRVIAQCLN